MDPLPPVPFSNGINDTVRVLHETFEEQLEEDVFPKDVARNIACAAVDEDLSLQETAENVMAIHQFFEEESSDISKLENDIKSNHAEYLISKNLMERNEFLREVMKLKPCNIFAPLKVHDKHKFGLIEKSDLYPDVIKQFLDFRFNTTLHRCKKCFPKKEFQAETCTPRVVLNLPRESQMETKVSEKIKSEPVPSLPQRFRLEPPEVVFRNFHEGATYEQTVKIRNVGSDPQSIVVKKKPTSPVISLTFEGGSRIAAGMFTTFKITFKPLNLLNFKDSISFVNRQGEILLISIKCFRDPPRLTAYVQKSIEYPLVVRRRVPGSREFNMRRQHAVNNTIDCGTCFTTEYVLISLILVNRGHYARFFWLTEDDFYNQTLNNTSTNMELSQGYFWIFPTYFEMDPNEICEINIIYQPLQCGMHAETVFLMCDNNTFRQIELIGDAVCLNKHIITVDVPNRTKEIETKKNHCIFLGHLPCSSTSNFTLSIINRSPLYIKYAFELAQLNEKLSMCEWIKVSNLTAKFLAPNSTTDVIFEVLSPPGLQTGYYNTKLRLFILDVPIASLEEDDVFFVKTNGKTLKEVTEQVSVVDVLVMDVEVACHIDEQTQEEDKKPPDFCEGCRKKDCTCDFCSPETAPEMADLEFDPPYLDLGILPLGADISREIQIKNLSDKQLSWNIAELKYNIDSRPHLQLLKENNISPYSGQINRQKTSYIRYNIVRKRPARYVSILILYVINREADDSKLIAESICLVTYEIVEQNIAIKTGHADQPILCPLEMLYVGVPVSISFKIKNLGVIPACFYFFSPIGDDACKISLEYNPQSGQLNPRCCQKITLKLICHEVGILENIFLPCFIGMHQDPLKVRLLCMVDCVHLFFYLPVKSDDFQKILWPPKVIYEYKAGWSSHCLCEELQGEYEETIKSIKSSYSMHLSNKSSATLNELKSHINLQKEEEKFVDENQEVLEALLSADSEIFLQDCVVQTKVNVKEPKKVRLYFENVTPNVARYWVQATNFSAKMNEIKKCLGPKYKKTEDYWEPMIKDYGILIQPESESGLMHSQELVIVDIWIYANTWGAYVEEIIVDIENIPSFCFSLVVQVVGCPLQLPLGIGAITKYPTIRFGTLAFDSCDIKRDILIRNISSVDVKVHWHLFHYNKENQEGDKDSFNIICDLVGASGETLINLDATQQFFGTETFDFIKMNSSTSTVKRGQEISVPITFLPCKLQCLDDKICIQCFILGKVFLLNDEDNLKSNYFYRKPNSLVIEVTARVEVPRLNITIEEDTLRIYANDIAVKRESGHHIKCLLQNPTTALIKAQLDCLEPFVLSSRDAMIRLGPGQCKQISLMCQITYEKILRWAPFVYQQTEIAPLDLQVTSHSELRLSSSLDRYIDNENKVITFHKKLRIYFEGGFKNQTIPINMSIFYPNIAVKPTHVKLGYVLVGRTLKETIYIYNFTGCEVLFEIYKSVSNQEIVVTPAHGEVPKSTGLNRNFARVSIYFTPTECKNYHESIRIMTNIPQYYIDVPIKGTGSFNEKFL
ncbi:uncharacterized protein LOC126742262 [Anthonomus grandis grandis]|uniref:uncharacterized protein LOC126742262 n=1 Tax=Anthonomus grandis grandis TaxID=2921223 RepID=UPI002165C1FD|nr:uncharacterized protein LOC126742262 [Anthonomus grandis grandis]